jgi:predicted ATPase
MIPIIADAMGFSFQGADLDDPKAQLLNHLQDKRMLLLLDNLEQLLQEPGIEFLSELLAAAPGVKLLVTSREPLNLGHEWVFEVAGLPVPVETADEAMAEETSVELFLQRARRAHARFSATAADYPAIVRICQLAGGVPLAIELAAAWVRTLTCEEIARELQNGPDLLAAPARDLPARHASMRAVFDHSWKLLSPHEQAVLARLSVFRGGFDREAAGRVAGASLQVLSALTAKSLVRRSAAGRYDLHELIRQYAGLYLQADPAADDDARRRHYDCYLDLVEAAAPHLKTGAQLEWLHRLEQEHDNLRAGLEWSLTTPHLGSALALRLAAALHRFWLMGSFYQEGCGYLRRALDLDGGLAPPAMPEHIQDSAAWQARAQALLALGLLENSLAHHAVAHALADQAAIIFRKLDDRQGLAEALIIMGQALHWQGDAALGQALVEEARELFQAVGDRWNAARALFYLGADLADPGGDLAGQRLLAESAAILDELGDRFVSGRLRIALGILAFTRGEYASALSEFARSLEIARELRDPWGIADSLMNCGCVLRVQGGFEDAGARFSEALWVYEQWGRGPWCADALCALAENEMDQGNLAAAASCLEKAAAFVMPSENKWLHVLVTYFQGLLAFYRGQVAVALELLEQSASLAHGGQFKPDLSRALLTLARAVALCGETERARRLNGEALALFARSGSKLGIAMSLESFARLALPEKAGRAARLLGTAESIRSLIGAPLPPVERPAYEETVEILRQRLGPRAFEEARECGRLERSEDVAEEIMAAFKSGQHLTPESPPGPIRPRRRNAIGST